MGRARRPHLVVTNSGDQGTAHRVAAHSRHEFLVLYLDHILEGVQDVSYWWDGGMNLKYNGEVYSTASLASGWWRKPHHIRVPHQDPLVAASIKREAISTIRVIEELLPEERWLNSPSRNENSARKFVQFAAAQRSGFKIPRTCMASSWKSLRFPEGTPLVFKLIDGTLARQSGTQVVFTEPVDLLDVPDSSPFPGLFQERLTGTYEWRVNVIQGDVFAARLSLPEHTVDWRREQLAGRSSFERGTLPKQVANACIEVTSNLKLRFSAIDLIQTPEDWYFLEANPNGEYGWLEDDLNFPVSESIAECLDSIAAAHPCQLET